MYNFARTKKTLRILSVSCALACGLQANAADASHPSHVPFANAKIPGNWAPNVLSPELIESPVAQGAMTIENPTDLVGYYGYNTEPGIPMLPEPGSIVEKHKTEPDKNAYLILKGQKGPDANYAYGKHFLFQGHESGLVGYLTRINLDADAKHRITLLAEKDINSNPLPTFDGITYYPFSRQLLLTAEGGRNGGVWQASLADDPGPFTGSDVIDISGGLGRGGYEGIQADSWGQILIVEDVGGSKGSLNNFARQPNSFVYRFIPNAPADLTKGGRLQALRVYNSKGQPIVFHAGQADADILSDDTKEIRTYGLSLATEWVTIHDTKKDGNTPFDANAAAKSAGATPFKRPENGLFRPGSNFSEFVFDETGDTDIRTQAGSAYGGFGSVFKLTMNPRGNEGRIQVVYLGDAAHAGFDNCAFWSKDEIVFVEDAGDSLHAQRNALDSGYLIDLNTDYSTGAQPVRILAEGRDPAATVDASLSGMAGFVNDGDNEITGIHVSNGDEGVDGLLGAKVPHPFDGRWRAFYTAQHGMNVTYEILPAVQNHGHDGRDRD